MTTNISVIEVVLSFVSALIGAAIGAGVSLRISRASIAQSKESIEVQRNISNRAAASFVADKRQHWIDALRADMATHLAESREIMWEWAAIRNRVKDDTRYRGLTDEQRDQRQNAELAEFSKANGALDRRHEERHYRLRFRLNPNSEETLHAALRGNLDEIRRILVDTNPNQPTLPDQQRNIDRIEELVSHSDALTSDILKVEWERVKQEVAYPEAMIDKIPRPSSQGSKS